jgi:CrcB protein
MVSQALPPSGEDRVFAPPTPFLEPLRGQRNAFAVVAAGGVLGALARWAVGLGLPTPAGAFPLATFAINVVGCLAIGIVIVGVTELRAAHPLVRPFLATGFLGGFTTFSTYAVDVEHLLRDGHLAVALGYLVATPVAAVAAAWIGITLTRAAGHRRTGR